MFLKIAVSIALLFLVGTQATSRVPLPIEKVPNLWTFPPRGQNIHTRDFHHFDEETGQYAKLKYHMETTGEVFSYIQDGIGIERMYCTNNNREVIVWFSTDKQARTFYEELGTSQVVSSMPPFVCGKAAILLRLRNVSMFGPRMVRIVGKHVDSFFELIKEMHMRMDTNMLSHNNGAEIEHEPAVDENGKHHWSTLSEPATELTREFYEDREMYRRREFEKTAQTIETQISSAHKSEIQSSQATIEDMTKLTEEKREKLIKKLQLEAEAESDSALAHHRIVQALDTWGTEKKCVWKLCVPTGIWVNYRADIGPKYWNIEMNMPDAIISVIKMAFPAIKSMTMGSRIDIMPVLHFFLKWDDWKLRNAELWLEVEWYYQAKFAINFNGAISKSVSIPLWNMKNLPGAIFPVGPIVFGLCPGVGLSLRPKVSVSGGFSMLRYKKTTGYFKFGFAYSQSTGLQKVNAKSGPTDVHALFDPVFHRCTQFPVTGRFGDANHPLSCAQKCLADANCKAYRMLNNMCEITNAVCYVDWNRDSAQGYYKRLNIEAEYFNGDVSVYIEVPVVLTLSLNAWISAGADPCTMGGVSVGGPWLTFAVGPYFDIKSKQLPDKTRQTDTEIGLIIEMTVGVTIMLKVKILVFSLTLWSMELAAVTLFTIVIPLSRERNIVDANNNLISNTKLTISGTSWISVSGPTLRSPFKGLEHRNYAALGKNKDTDIPTAAPSTKAPVELDGVDAFVDGYTPSTQFTGLCDSDVFVYRTRVQYVSKARFVISYFIDHGDKSCSLQGLYHGKAVKGDHLHLEHVIDKTFDRDSCWMQDIPKSLKVVKSSNDGIHVYNRWSYCADIALRQSSSFTMMKAGQSIIADQTLSNVNSRFSVRSNGDVDLVDIDTNAVLWSAGTGSAIASNGNRLISTLTFTKDGNLVLEKYYEGSADAKTTKVIGGAAGAKYLEIKDCDVVMYGETMGAPNVDKVLWSMTNRDECDDLHIVGDSPKWHRGGNILYTGEILNENAGLYNSECIFQHDYGRAHIISWDTLKTTWTTAADESLITQNTAALTLMWNGNLALFDKNGAIIWETKTAGSQSSFLRLEGCRLVLYRTDELGVNTALWTIDGNPKKPSFVENVPELPAPKLTSGLRRAHMELGDYLLPGQSIMSRNAILIHQPDGNVALYLRNTSNGVTPVWTTNTAGKCTSAFALSHDGNLGLYACSGSVKGNPQLWSTGALAQRPRFVSLNDDCTLQLYAQAFKGTYNPDSTIKALYETKCQSTFFAAPFAKVIDHITQGNKIERGQSVFTARNALVHQPDGNLVYFSYRPQTKILWQSKTSGQCTGALLVNNGNIILRSCGDKTTLVWQALASDVKSDGMNITLRPTYFALENMFGKLVWRSDGGSLTDNKPNKEQPTDKPKVKPTDAATDDDDHPAEETKKPKAPKTTAPPQTTTQAPHTKKPKSSQPPVVDDEGAAGALNSAAKVERDSSSQSSQSASLSVSAVVVVAIVGVILTVGVVAAVVIRRRQNDQPAQGASLL
eukprot:PhF_6_TR12248/c3_g1_i2/m.19402